MKQTVRATTVVGQWAAPALMILGCAVVMVVFGWVWRRDRLRVWAEPRFEAREFVRLSGDAAPGAREFWLVAVNPKCPHCRGHLARAAIARRRSIGVRLGILLVDTPKPPAAPAFAHVAVDGLWWDARDTWRRRWGHRVYGEVMVFDRAGRYLRTMPPGFDATQNPGP